ncbi:tetratricopeptide repeat protein [Halalkalibacterium halodurans]|uniref:Aspartate phosphatase n=2 Tax=Halalkalibacterium halodurans TaxID=86665 RepID=A0A0M0KFS5_ALKHA|nr:tetratricopeptide repeat protein [Halalkalibacterium halodurans]MED4126468.1 tetratricopeptide repeat protein [Halalkalibacterium halodurans]TES47646.1 tetratricopeptide repeat protein [Halalkalibacterium halodurans]TPE65874.1 tetratricopeptide repeat protein [Halalkalibacterium halodurans]
MVERVASSEVANRLNEWYDTIKRQDIKKAAIMKHDLQKAMDDMEEDQNVLLYYNLIDSRYKLLLEQYDESGTILESLKDQTERADTDNLLQYYYYFFSGLYEFNMNNFTHAIRLYHKAENHLTTIPDEIEHAEFHFQLAVAYQSIDQNFFSINHAEKALDIYLKQENYVSRIALTQMIIAANKLDLNQYLAAEKLYKKAILIAVDSNQTFIELLGYYNLGLCYEVQEKLELARDCFEKALDFDFPQENKKETYLRIKYMLGRVLFKMGFLQEGVKWFEDAVQLANETNDKIYQVKLEIIHAVYFDQKELSIDEGLKVLKEQSLWHDVEDLAFNAARFYKKEGFYQLASKYYEEGLNAQQKIPSLYEEVGSA